MILAHGQVFAGQRVLGLLGQGAFGSVYRVVSPAGTEAALKLLNAEGLASEAHRRRFEREAAALGKLRHPNVLQLTSHGQEAGVDFLLLEFVQGPTLESRVLDGGALAMEEVADLGAKLAGALAAAHALGLVHRDVKPANVILRAEDGEPILVDFGLVKDLERLDQTQLTKTGTLTGTPLFWSPEQASGARAGPASDVYSLGATLFYALTGRNLFEAGTLVEAAVATVGQAPPAASDFRSGVWPSADVLLLECLKKAPEERPTSTDLADAFTLLEAPTRPGVGVAALVALVLILSSGFVGLLVARSRAPVEVPPSPTAAVGPGPVEPTPEALLSDGRAALAEGSLEEAAGLFRRAAQRGNVPAMLALGELLGDRKRGEASQAESLRWWRAAAEQGVAEAMTSVGNAYAAGAGVPTDPLEAYRWHLKGAQAGDGAGMVRVGVALAAGQGRKRNPELAAEWYRRACALGNVEAMTKLGEMLSAPRGIPLDQVQGRALLLRAAEGGWIDAMELLSQLLLAGQGGPRDQRGAVRWMTRAAEGGNTEAMHNLASVFSNGRGVPVDHAAANRWLRRAANAGHALAMVSLGHRLQFGLGGQRNEPEAARLYRKAAKLGDSDAMFSLGKLYGAGRGVTQNLVEARRWYRASAERGNAGAMNSLGVVLDHGLGGEVDARGAVLWYERAIAQGSSTAMNNLGVMYLNGKGVSRDLTKAARLFGRGAQLGSPWCMINLGVMLRAGHGVARDEAAGRRWLERALQAKDPAPRAKARELLGGG